MTNVTAESSERDHKAATEVFAAAALGDLRSLQRLDNLDVSFACTDYDARTPLHVAIAEGHLDVVRFLLATPGADVVGDVVGDGRW